MTSNHAPTPKLRSGLGPMLRLPTMTVAERANSPRPSKNTALARSALLDHAPTSALTARSPQTATTTRCRSTGDMTAERPWRAMAPDAAIRSQDPVYAVGGKVGRRTA
jgi:hypothetical protein